ncbi:helix-turn-helix domain-containing protein [Humibacillus sp. DSM 29435]|uniref:excisionase family DNA-binding protein n=1 Tax=Humibacillus sp. DSM 29435 TaxID=1869167 RepID=UPI00158676D3
MPLLTTGQAAQLLGCSRQHVVDLCESGDLPYLTVGTHRRLRREDVEQARQRTTRSNRSDRRSRWLNIAVAGALVRNPDTVLRRVHANLALLRASHPRAVARCGCAIGRSCSTARSRMCSTSSPRKHHAHGN